MQHGTLHLFNLSFGAVESSLLALALALALFASIQLIRLQRRDGLLKRIGELKGTVAIGIRTKRTPWYDWIGNVVARSPLVGSAERKRLSIKLAGAGFSGSSRVATFIGIKTGSMFLVVSMVWSSLDGFALLAGKPAFRLIVLLIAVLAGWRLPDLVLARLSTRRLARLEIGFPDAVDLLVICAEAGLGLEQAIGHVAHDLRLSAPEVAAEFAITASEIRVIADRRLALDNLAERTGLASLRGLVSTLSQSSRFGTPLSELLRVLAGEMRLLRITRLEERAARLSVTLMLPLMLFILPCLFLVIGGPIVLRAIDAFTHVKF